MAEQLSVTREIAAPAEQVYAMVSDVTRMGEWSPENVGGVWLGGATGPALGAKFKGTNKNGSKKWTTVSTIVAAETGRSFAFNVVAGVFKVAEWRYTFEPTETGCRVTETWTDQRSRITTLLGKPVSGVADRAAHNREGMERTLEGLARVAESSVA